MNSYKDIVIFLGALVCGSVIFYTGVKTGSSIYKEANQKVNTNKNISVPNIKPITKSTPKQQDKKEHTVYNLLMQTKELDFKSPLVDQFLKCKTAFLYNNINKEHLIDSYNLKFKLKKGELSSVYNGTIDFSNKAGKKSVGTFSKYVRYHPQMKNIIFLILDKSTFTIIGLDEKDNSRFVGNVFTRNKATFDLVAFAELKVGK